MAELESSSIFIFWDIHKSNNWDFDSGEFSLYFLQ